MGITASLFSNNKIAATVADLDGKRPAKKRNSMGSSLSSFASSSSSGKYDVGKIIAIEAILKHDQFHAHYLKIISQNHKIHFVRHYEELEAIKKIIPNKKHDPRHTVASYKFEAIMQTSPTLKSLFQTERISPEDSETVSTTADSSFSKIHKKLNQRQHRKAKLTILSCLGPLLAYKETMISPEDLHNLLAECQWSLLGHLTVEYDLFVRSSDFQKLVASLPSESVTHLCQHIHQLHGQLGDVPGLAKQVSSILKDFPVPDMLSEELSEEHNTISLLRPAHEDCKEGGHC